jgi:hypothetical protein
MTSRLNVVLSYLPASMVQRTRALQCMGFSVVDKSLSPWMLSPVLDHITPPIMTCNEAVNVRRTLDKLGWVRPVLVVDSGSPDSTIRMGRG